MDSQQFVALEAWIEAYGNRNSAGPGMGRHALHVARQKAFTALTGIEAPISGQPQDDSDLA